MKERICNKCFIRPANPNRKHAQCKQCRNEIERARYNPEKDKLRHLKHWYGLTKDQYENMFVLQNFQCAICGVDLKSQKKTNVDHDHKTGRVRAILCVKCNLSIGLLENEGWIVKALDYLKKHKM